LFSNIQRLFSIVWLRDEQIVDIYTQFLCIETVECVLCVDKGCRSAILLGFGNCVYG
jgi:hypothetical protein